MLSAHVTIRDNKKNFIDDLMVLAKSHGIEYLKPTVLADSTQFRFIFKDGEEEKKDAFLKAIPIDWL